VDFAHRAIRRAERNGETCLRLPVPLARQTGASHRQAWSSSPGSPPIFPTRVRSPSVTSASMPMPTGAKCASFPSSPTMPWSTASSITSSSYLWRRDLLRLKSLFRKFWWPPKPAMSTFYDPLLTWREKLWVISGVFEPPGGFPGRCVLFLVIFSPY